MDLTDAAITLFSSLTVFGQIIAVVLIAVMFTEYCTRHRSAIVGWVSSHAILLMCIVAVAAMAGSLYFSEIAGWTPCKDCWLQRIFLYPQVPLLIIALWKRDRGIAPYIFALCIIGLYFSGDHYFDQVEAALNPVSADPLKPCDLSGVPCAATEIHFTFGYITIPLMALTASLLNAVGSVSMMMRRSAA